MSKKPKPESILSPILDITKLREECPGVSKLSPETCAACLEKLDRELAKARSDNDISRQVELLRLMGNCCLELKQFSEAEKHLNRLVEIASTGYEVNTLNVVFNGLGRISLLQGKFALAAQHFQKALELSEASGNLDQAAGMCLNLSTAFSHLGQPEQCKEYLQRAMDSFSQTGNIKMVHMTKSSLGNLLLSMGALHQALELKEQCISYNLESGDKAQLAKELNTKAVICFQMDKLEKAIESALEALKLKEELNDTLGIASQWLNLGVFYRDFGDREAALQYYLQALPVFEKYGVKHSVSLCLNNISNCYLQKHEPQAALEYLLKAHALKLETGELIGTSLACLNIANIYRGDLNDPVKALEYYELAIQHAQQCQADMELSEARLFKAATLASLKRGEEALSLLSETTTHILKQGWEKQYLNILRAEADVYEALAKWPEACVALRKGIALTEELHSAESLAKIAEMRARYEADKKEQEAEIYRLKNIELQEKNHLIEEQKNKLQETLDKLYQSEIRYDFVSEQLTRNIGSTLIGSSQTIHSITQMIAMVAKSERTNVLITGETGTGKEIVARNIHLCSNRGRQHFYAVNCSAVPDNLFESQFFGHEKDAFTGATSIKVGWFEIANNSTLFLDEIGSLSFDQQAKLLRALEEHCIVRVGSHREIPIDVRIVSATNVNLLHKVDQEEFRRDLYHRLAIFVINIPPLRERREDIPILLKHFVGLASMALSKKISKVDKAVISYLAEYDFPGNVRELRNMVERAVLVADRSTLQKEHFLIPQAGHEVQLPNGVVALDTLERDMILRALQSTGYNRVQAAKLLGVDRKVVERKILKHNIGIPD